MRASEPRSIRPASGSLPRFVLVAAGLLILFAFAFAFAGTPAAAQVNVEPLTPDEPPEGVSGSVGGNLTVQTGNTDFVRLGVDARMYRVRGIRTTLLVANGGIGFLGSSRFASSGLFHYRRTYETWDWVEPEWYAQVNYDRSQNLRFRTLAGGGIRSPVVQAEWGHVGAGTGFMLEDERLALPDTAVHPDHTTVIRSSSYGSFRYATEEGLVVTSSTYVQPQVGEWRDVRLLEDLAFATSVTESLALTVSFDLRYDSRPPDGIASLDTRLRTGLTLSY